MNWSRRIAKTECWKEILRGDWNATAHRGATKRNETFLIALAFVELRKYKLQLLNQVLRCGS